jgi:hypothetical protein
MDQRDGDLFTATRRTNGRVIRSASLAAERTWGQTLLTARVTAARQGLEAVGSANTFARRSATLGWGSLESESPLGSRAHASLALGAGKYANGGVDVAPAMVVLVEDVRPGARVTGTEGRVLDERRVRRERPGDGEDGRELLELDADEAGGLLGGVERVGGDGRDRLAVVVGLAYREHGPVLPLRPEARHRVGQIGGCRHEPNTWDPERCRRVDPADPRARHVKGDELDVEGVVVGQVGDVLLLPGDAGTAADPGCRLSDAHCGATFASGTADRSPTGDAAVVVSWALPPAAARTASMICS